MADALEMYLAEVRPCDHWMRHIAETECNSMRALPVIHLQDEVYLAWRAMLAARGETMASRIRDHVQRDVSRAQLRIEQTSQEKDSTQNTSTVDTPVVQATEQSIRESSAIY